MMSLSDIRALWHEMSDTKPTPAPTTSPARFTYLTSAQPDPHRLGECLHPDDTAHEGW